MANLEVNYCGVKYRNPLILASATPGWDGEGMRLAAEAGIGGVIPKTIGPKVDWAAHPRNGRIFMHRYNGKAIGQVNLELFTTMTRERWITKELQIAKSGGATMHISILAMPDPEEIRRSGETVRLGGTVYRFELDRKRKLAVVGVDYSARLSDGASLERNTLCEAPIRDDSPAAAVRAMSEAVERSAAAAKQLVLELLKGAGEEKPASLTNGTETK